MQPVEYVIFDLDGLLIDSEKYCVLCQSHGLFMHNKQDIHRCNERNLVAVWEGNDHQYQSWTDGKTLVFDCEHAEKEAATHLLSFFPDIDLTVDQYILQRRQKQDALWPTVVPLPGVLKLLQHLHDHSIPIAIATGSQKRNFALKTSHLPHMLDFFAGHIVCADDVERGKPHPDVFLAAAARLGRRVGQGDYTMVDEAAQLERSKGLIFEDAIPGVQAGVRAGMQVIWVPDVTLTALSEGNGLRVQETLVSLMNFVPEKWGLPPYPVESSFNKLMPQSG